MPHGPSALEPGPSVRDRRLVSTDTLILDQMVPRGDAEIAAHAIVEAPPAAVYGAARSLDFLTVHSPLLDASMWVRGLADRLAGSTVEVPPTMTLEGIGEGLPGWLLFGSTEGHEIAFGAVGRFWTPKIEWRPVAVEEFADFTEPGWGKIGCAFVVTPYGVARSMLTYECRTITTDDESRRRFRRYWMVVRPFVGHIMRATVRTIAASAAAPQS